MNCKIFNKSGTGTRTNCQIALGHLPATKKFHFRSTSNYRGVPRSPRWVVCKDDDGRSSTERDGMDSPSRDHGHVTRSCDSEVPWRLGTASRGPIGRRHASRDRTAGTDAPQTGGIPTDGQAEAEQENESKYNEVLTIIRHQTTPSAEPHNRT